MKIDIEIKIDGKKYFVKIYPNGSNSNFNHALCIKETKKKNELPIAGTSISENFSIKEIENWCNRIIKVFNK